MESLTQDALAPRVTLGWIVQRLRRKGLAQRTLLRQELGTTVTDLLTGEASCAIFAPSRLCVRLLRVRPRLPSSFAASRETIGSRKTALARRSRMGPGDRIGG